MLAPNLNTPIHLAGDEDRGFSTTFDLRTGAVAQARMIYTGKYAVHLPELEVRCEIYEVPGKRSVHLFCVRCSQCLMVHTGGKISIEYERDPGYEFVRLYITPSFECPGCKTSFAYDGRVIKDA